MLNVRNISVINVITLHTVIIFKIVYKLIISVVLVYSIQIIIEPDPVSLPILQTLFPNIINIFLFSGFSGIFNGSESEDPLPPFY